MSLTLKVVASILFIFQLSACDKARFDLANNKSGQNRKAGDGDPKKPGCGENIATIGVYNSNGELMSTMTPWAGSLSAEENYAFSNYQANIQIGPSMQSAVANHFIYQTDDSARYLFLVVDQDYDSSTEALFSIDVMVSGNQRRDDVVVSDESAEFELEDVNGDENIYEGRFFYTQHSDGAVVGPLYGDEWQIRMVSRESNRVDKIKFADKKVGGLSHPLSLGAEVILRPLSLDLCELPQ